MANIKDMKASQLPVLLLKNSVFVTPASIGMWMAINIAHKIRQAFCPSHAHFWSAH